MSLPIPHEWLFQGLFCTEHALESQSHIFAPGPAAGRITRWAIDQFPLKVWTDTDDFSTLEANLLEAQLYQTFSEISALNPSVFSVAQAPTPESADVVLTFIQAIDPEAVPPGPNHPLDQIRIGPEGQLRRVELVIPIAHAGAPAARQVVETALRALGVFTPAQATPEALSQPHNGALTAVDKDTLVLLYRCPIALSHKELNLLWRGYQARHASKRDQDDVLDAILNSPPDREAKVIARTLLRRRSSELSLRELALQESIQSALANIESA